MLYLCVNQTPVINLWLYLFIYDGRRNYQNGIFMFVLKNEIKENVASEQCQNRIEITEATT